MKPEETMNAYSRLLVMAAGAGTPVMPADAARGQLLITGNGSRLAFGSARIVSRSAPRRRISAIACASSAGPTPPRRWRGSMDSLFKSSVPDASSGRQRDDASDLSGGPGRDPHITGGDALWGDREGGGHQCHESGIVAPYRSYITHTSLNLALNARSRTGG
jgi:hypothetical protein